MQDWWTDERVDHVVTAKFVLSRLDQRTQARLNDVVFEELSDDSYLDWILVRAKRLFLILNDIGCATHILHLIDLSYEDSALPIAERHLPGLRLPQQTTKQDIDLLFYKTQLKYLVRTIREGEHVRYSMAASVPLHVVDYDVPSTYAGAQDRVRLPAPDIRTFMRVRVRPTSRTALSTAVADIQATREISHEHAASVFASYVQDDSMYLLVQPAAHYTLKSFLSDLPKAFKNLDKPIRHTKLLQWPHCLSNGLAWLHMNNLSHGAISPSRILVDDEWNPVLGHFRDIRPVGSSADIEIYQYASPESCQRRLMIQTSGPSGRPGQSGLNEYAEMRGALPSSPRGGGSYANGPGGASLSPTSPISRAESRMDSATFPAPPGRKQLPVLDIPEWSSAHYSSSTSDGGGSSSNNSQLTMTRATRPADFRQLVAPESRAAVVSALKASSGLDPQASDVFSLAAVSMDVMSVVGGETPSGFTKHRSSSSASSRDGSGGGGGSRGAASTSRAAAVVDSSVHANLSRVGSWAGKLAKDAEKRSKKGHRLLDAVSLHLEVLLQCLNKDPRERPRADMLSLTLEANLHESGGLKELHCALRPAHAIG